VRGCGVVLQKHNAFGEIPAQKYHLVKLSLAENRGFSPAEQQIDDP
jgi:hypothetical protein